MIFRAREPSIGTFTMDVTLSEEHSIEVEVTESPTEGGGVSGGVKRVLPRRVTIEGIVTASDMHLGAREGLAVYNHVKTGEELNPFAQGTRHLDAWEQLKALWKSEATFDVTTDVDTYRNCTGVGELVWVRSAGPEGSGALRFTATFREVIAGNVVVTPSIDPGSTGAASQGTDLGRLGLEVVE